MSTWNPRAGAETGGRQDRTGLGRIRWVLEVAAVQRPPLVGVAILALVGGLAEAGALVAIVALTAGALGGDAAGDVGLIDLGRFSAGQVGLLGALLITVALIVNVASSLVMSRLSTSGVAHLRDRLVSAHLGSSAATQESVPEGKMAELTGIGAYQVEAALGSVGNFLSAVALLFAYLVVAVVTQPVAAFAAILSGLLLLLLMRPIAGAARAAMRRYVDRSAELLQWCAQIVSLTLELRTFGVEDAAVAEARARNEAAADAGRRARFLLGVSPAIYQAAALALVLTGVLAARSVETVEPATLAAVAVLLVRALSLTQRVSLAVQGLGAAAPHIEDVVATTDLFLTNRHPTEGVPVRRVGELRVDDAEFAYERSSPVLRGISFSIKRGESVAVVGPSGGGKTTLFQLLLRLRAPDSGTVSIDGRSIWDVDERSFRAQVALVPQDNRLLLGSITDNVEFLRPIDEAEVHRALELAALEDAATIATGDVGAGAAQLSGGQRQRVGLARALVGGPSILLLDEPTSALDHATERVVNETLKAVRGRVAVVVIAHRPSTVAACDRVLVLEGGRLVADGPLSEVIETNDYVRTMFE